MANLPLLLNLLNKCSLPRAPARNISICHIIKVAAALKGSHAVNGVHVDI